MAAQRLLCFDLDHTVIYSYRHALPGKPVLVELNSGKPLSYMTEETFSFFRRNADAPICFVSARTPEQFRRIVPFQEELPFPAVLCGGSLLLRNGRIVQDFFEESCALAADSIAEIERISKLFQRFCSPAHIHGFPPLFAYAVTDGAQQAAEQLRQEADGSLVRIYADGRKLYCLPANTDKGTAVSRLRARLQAERVFAAGDSEFDIPMLNAADCAAAPAALRGQLSCENVCFCENAIISDEVCAAAERFLTDSWK